MDIAEHDHTYDARNGLHECAQCKREAIVCPQCGLCTLCLFVPMGPLPEHGTERVHRYIEERVEDQALRRRSGL